MKKTNGLHITVGVCPSGDMNINKEIDLLKTALIYADKVILCSVKTALLFPFFKLNTFEQIELMGQYVSTTEEKMMLDEFKNMYNQIKNAKRPLSEEDLIFELQLNELLRFIKSKLLSEYSNSGYTQLEKIDKQHLEIQTYGSVSDFKKPELILHKYFNHIGSSLQNNTYLLLDCETGSALNEAIKLGYLESPSQSSIDKAKHASLVSNLFHRLPCFDFASLDELLDIKKELSKPLIRFRSAIVGYSDNIKSQPWDDSFEYDCEKLFIKEIEPTILDIEESFQSNSLLKKLVKKSIELLPVGGGAAFGAAAFGAFISQSTNFPDICAASITGGGMALAGKTVKEWHEERTKAQTNHLFFYYKTKEKILNNYSS